MSVLCWRPWPSATAHSSRSLVELDSNCNKHRRGDYFRTSRWSTAARLPRGCEKVVTCAKQGRSRTENLNATKQETEFCEENSVSFALGSGQQVEKDVSENCSSWQMRRGLEQDPVSEEVKINSSVLQEDEFSRGEEKILRHDDNTREDCNENNRRGSKRHGEKFRRRAAILAAGSAALSSMSCFCCSKVLAAGSEGSGLQWDYGGPSGVDKWQGLCAVGPKQSPIDIPLSKAISGESLGELQFHYESSTPTILNPGHGTMQVSFAQGKNILRVGDRNLELLQFHFHSPSEHAFDGERFAMEAHLVHKDKITSKLAVVGIMLAANKFALQNKCLAESLAYAPAEHGRSVLVQDVTFSPNLLLPAVTKNGKREYVHYVGSLSTPPCSEGVDWFVLEKSLEIPTSQVLDFLKFAGDGHSLAFNSRPLQPLGNRVVYKGPL